MNSYSNQIYTIKWANKIKQSLIISIDYSKSPENPYPNALNDVWQAYNYIIKHLPKKLNVIFNSVILAGDSAGGNLCVGLLNLLIQEKKMDIMPDGLQLTYPALGLQKSFFSPSKLYSLTEYIMPASFLQICLECYIPENYRTFLGDFDSLLSPVLIENSIIQKFPKCFINCGELDPLLDDTVRFFYKINLNRNGTLRIFKGLGHGYINYGMKFGVGMSASQKCIDYVIYCLILLIQDKRKKKTQAFFEKN
ncbi:hypothetical protein IMG5_118180 [Ichthyophthirius multifiliis]|uniref:Alpha/beta hydrolase fold-3 domain-containing protein n=1 Tax=Ichthyophthirius multifiliis TaxID=5932 RepID=G0QUK9_ICHMU|nr:hypothetical protein IMG5_118180 [Ichthyophthirius multifiliis]EGR31093.1 hypothetical protein IMG5_118180 [Ichthyophthirius multifiliis]|eukprot:XP_004034579.1 hypothetical protein IMG5_118180 [Ichthyophthirius multifiliis]